MKKLYAILIIILVIFGFYLVLANNDKGDTILTSKLEFGEYSVNENSTLTWQGSRIIGGSHIGEVKIEEGFLNFGESSQVGEFVIDMQSISESKNNERFLSHIKNDDFFSVDTYPKSTFKINNISFEDDKYVIFGSLTIKDITQDINFPAYVTHNLDDLTNILASFEIDRTLWGINYDSGSIFSDIGDRAIRDEIKYDLNLFLKRD